MLKQSHSPSSFFCSPQGVFHTRYEALRSFFVGGMPANQVAKQFGYTLSTFYSLVRDFKIELGNDCQSNPFFIERKVGRNPLDQTGEINQLIISLRKKYLSVPDIKSVLDVHQFNVSESYVYLVIKNDGFDRLPRRNITTKKQSTSIVKIEAPKSTLISFSPETFSSQNSLGILCLLPYLQKCGIIQLIENSMFPSTKSIGTLSSILCFLALKLSHFRRYTTDDAWCMDRGLGLFAGLNVLPKAAWFSSYSHRVTRAMNLDFLRSLCKLWTRLGILSDTANLDFTAIPYWGDDSHLENNWSGKRNKSLASILAVLAQDPDSGIITYADSNLRHDKESQVVLEFLDFYKENSQEELRYLVFDSKFTTYENLAKLDSDIKFLTIRRRGKKIVDEINQIKSSDWKKTRIQTSNGKGRYIKVHDSRVFLAGYGKEIRQIVITGNGKIKPALLITNDFLTPYHELVRKYAKRWLVEKGISEQIEFFHLNKVSSSMVIKVNFDLTMSVLAHNLLRLFAMDLPGYQHNTSMTLYNKFLQNSGVVQIQKSQILIMLKKKRNLPAVLTAMEPYQNLPIDALGKRSLVISAGTSS